MPSRRTNAPLYDDATARRFEDRWWTLRPGESDTPRRALRATPAALSDLVAALGVVADPAGSVDARVAARLVDRTPAQWTPLMLREARRIARSAARRRQHRKE